MTSIPWARPELWGLEQEYVADALASTWVSGGPYLVRLETELRAWTGCRFALAVSNGTAAIHAAYLAFGLQPGDEVIVPGFGFQAAANIALQMGVRPVFAEVDPETWCLGVEQIDPCLSPRTRLIIPVHTYGNVCPMDEICRLGAERGVAVFEDAAEAFGSRWRGRLAGTFGAAGSFSFQATKTITTGEGGLVLTDDAEFAETLMKYRSHGMLKTRYWHDVPGHNFRLTNLQAALGCAQFERREIIFRERARVHRTYDECLAGLDGVRPQFFPPKVEPVLWAIAVRLDDRAYPQGRDAVSRELAAVGIETRPGFYPPSVQPLYNAPPLPVCEAISRSVLSLPTFPGLTDEQIHRICEALRHVRH